MDRTRLAALNNALWCDQMCRAHGLATEFTENLWVCRGTPPRYHSQATTLAPGAKVDLANRGIGAFKDGFFDVDGESLRCSELFQASWIWMDAPLRGATLLEWRRVHEDVDLLTWEAGWETDTDAPLQFPASLLENPNNAFLGGYRDTTLVAGCILNLTPPVVGISNTFAHGVDLADLWHDLARVSAQIYPGCPLTGYERGSDLDAAVYAGFEVVSELRVFIPKGD